MSSLTMNKSMLITVLLMIAMLVVIGLLVAQATLHLDLVSFFFQHHLHVKPLADWGYGGD